MKIIKQLREFSNISEKILSKALNSTVLFMTILIVQSERSTPTLWVVSVKTIGRKIDFVGNRSI